MLVFEDIHWAEPQLLDLIEYVATWARETPLVIVCTSRPELLDSRSGWGSGRMETSRISLEPLSEEESRSLLAALLAVDDLPPELRQRVLDRAEGNPLFVEEVVRMLIEEGLVIRQGDRWQARREAADVRVPDSVEALIRARLDTLPSPERAVLQAASVVGRIFQQSAVAAISPEAERRFLQRHLEEAILRDLISEERVPDEPTFRFRHILIRDVAYATLPKARRAALHLAVAEWLRAWAGPRIDEFVEIEAYHLEQSVRLRLELEGSVGDAERAAAVGTLETSARHALARDDARATRSFAERALALDPPPGEQHMEIEWLLADALLRLNEFGAAGAIGTRLESEAAAAGRKDLEGRAVLARARDIWVSLDSINVDAALAELSRARALLTEAGDDIYLVDVLRQIGYGGWWHGHVEDSMEAWTEMRRVAHRHGWLSLESEAIALISRGQYYRGDLDAVLRMLGEARDIAARGTSRLSRARVERAYGSRVAISGLPDAADSDAEAEDLLRSAVPVLEEYADKTELNIACSFLGEIEMRRGHPAEALELYRQALSNVMEHGGYRAEVQRHVAEALLALGEIDRAAEMAEEATTLVADDDIFTIASTSMVLGLVREAQGDLEEAERLLRSAVDSLVGTDFNGWDFLLPLAEFLYRRGRLVEAAEMGERALTQARLSGPYSPLPAYAERRLAEARESAGAA